MKLREDNKTQQDAPIKIEQLVANEMLEDLSESSQKLVQGGAATFQKFIYTNESGWVCNPNLGGGC